MAYEQTAPNAVSFQYSFKPQGDMQANSINAQVVLATEFTAGRAYETDNEKGVFPVSHGGIHLLRTKAVVQDIIANFARDAVDGRAP